MLPEWLYTAYKNKIQEMKKNLSVPTYKYFYIMADDLNLRLKSILSLYNT